MVSPHCSSLQVSLQEKTQVHEARLRQDSMDMSPTDLSACRDTVVSGDCSWGTTCPMSPPWDADLHLQLWQS